ncbi:MAG: SPFH domain-containing protein [Pseudomonadota bacterium]
MKRLTIFATASIAALALTGCIGESVQVPPAYVGKVLTKDGFQPGLVSPSQFRLPLCFFYCDRLILVESSDFGLREEFRNDHALYMPKSELAMPFDVRGTFAVRNDDRTLQAVFDRVPAKGPRGVLRGLAHGVISKSDIYRIYGKAVVRDVVRRIVSQYTIEQVASSRAAINARLIKAVNEALLNTPLVARRFGLADVRFPKVILDQKETAARRRIAIQQEEAEKQIRLVKLQADLEAARAERQIRRERAQAVLEENKIYAQSVTARYLAYRRLEVLEKLANSPNTKWVPFEALGTVGQSVALFAPQPKGTPKPKATPQSGAAKLGPAKPTVATAQ